MNDLLELIDAIDQETCISEMEICDSLMSTYVKSFMIMEQYPDSVIPDEMIFQEGKRWDKIKDAGSSALEEAKGNKSENIIIRILKFIPRFIAAFIRHLRANKKTIKKKKKEAEKIANQLADLCEHPQKYVKPSVTVTTSGSNAGVTNVEKPSANVAAKKETAKNMRTMKRKARENVIFALPMKDLDNLDSNGKLNYSFYANGDFRLGIQVTMFEYLNSLHKDMTDFASMLLPAQDALIKLFDALHIVLDQNGREWNQSNRMKAAGAVTSEVDRREKSGSQNAINDILNECATKLNDSQTKIESIGKKYQDYATKIFRLGQNRQKTEMMFSDAMNKFDDAIEQLDTIEQTMNEISKKCRKMEEYMDNNVRHLELNKAEGFSTATVDNEQMNLIKRQIIFTQSLVGKVQSVNETIVNSINNSIDILMKYLFEEAEKAGIEINEIAISKFRKHDKKDFDKSGELGNKAYSVKYDKIIE